MDMSELAEKVAESASKMKALKSNLEYAKQSVERYTKEYQTALEAFSKSLAEFKGETK